MSRLNIIASRVTSGWNTSGISWNNQPSFSDTVIDYSVVSGDTAECYLNFDITACAIDWYAGGGNYGIVLRSATEATDGFVSFLSSDDAIFSTTRPSFYVTYYDTKGLDDRWDFVTGNVGAAGTVNVNLYNGKPVVIGPSVAAQNSILPISAFPVYNGYLSGLQFAPNSSNKNAPVTADFNSNAGFGFKLSLWESIVQKTICGVSYYCYTDSDGTELYLRCFDGLGYVSEDGYDLTLTFTATQNQAYKLTDGCGNIKCFDQSGKITAALDESGNRVLYNYDSTGRLCSVSFKSVSMSVAETELILLYNSGNSVKKIYNAKSPDICLDFYYSASYNGTISQTSTGFLRKIVSPDGSFAEYLYNSNGSISRVREGKNSFCGAYVTLSYSSGGFVSELCEYGSDGAAGNKCTFSFEYKKTIVRTAGADDIYGNSDDLSEVFLFDNYGNTTVSYTVDAAGNEIYGVSSQTFETPDYSVNPKSNNHAVSAATQGAYLKNYLKNGNLESTYNWTVATGNAQTGTSTAEFLFGTKSVYIYGTSGNSSGILTQNVSITEPGTYTFSCYAKSALTMGNAASINGAYISVDGLKSDVIDGETSENVRDGWRFLSVSKTFESAGVYVVSICLSNMSGYVYFDGATFVKGGSPSGNFNYIGGTWIYLTGTYVIDSDGNLRLSPSVGSSAVCYEPVSLNMPAAAAAFVLSGWGKGFSVPDKDTTCYPASMSSYIHKERFWGLSAVIRYTDGTCETQKVSFNSGISDEWQYASGIIMPSDANASKTICGVTVYLLYDYNANYALFRDVSLVETDAVSYKYDENGDVTETKNGGKATLLAYSGSGDSSRLTSVFPAKEVFPTHILAEHTG